jgi:cell division protein FtsL
MGRFLHALFRSTSVPLTRRQSADSGGERRAEDRRVRNGERGGANIKAIVWTAILVVFIYVMAMLLPVLVNEYQFQDSLQDIARFASVNHRSNEQIKQAILDIAQKQELPVQAEDIKVSGTGGNVRVDVDYSVTIDLKVYQWTLNFHPSASNASLL